MAFLKVFTNGEERTVFLGNDPVVFGRGKECDILLKDRKASRVHCVVEPGGDGLWRLRDLESGNGTLLNGAKIADQLLEPEDVIQIGDARILFAGEAAAVVDGAAPRAEERPRGRARRAPARKSSNTVAVLAVAGLLLAAVVLFFVLDGLGGGTVVDPIEKRDYDVVMSARVDEDRVRLAETFLNKYPESEFAAEVREEAVASRRRIAGGGAAGLADGWDPAAEFGELPAREMVGKLDELLATAPPERRAAVRTALVEYRERLREERDAFFGALEQDVARLAGEGEFARAREMWFFLRGEPNWEPIPAAYLPRIVGANEKIENAAAAARGRLLEEEARFEAAHQFKRARRLLLDALPRFKGTSVERSVNERLETVERALKLGVVGTPSGTRAPASLVRVDVEKKMRGVMARLELRRWAEVAAGLRALADQARKQEDPGFREIHARAREAEAANALHRAMVAGLAGGTLPKGQVARKWHVLSGGPGGVKVRNRGAEREYPWEEAPAELYLALLRPQAARVRRGHLGLAVIAEAAGTNADVLAALEAGYAADRDRKLLDRFVAARLKREAMPDGGYVVHAGEVLSRKQYLRKEEEKLIGRLQVQLDETYEKIRGAAAFKRIEKLKKKKDALDKAREYALDLIFDEKTYFYPYRGTGRMGEYTKVQQEVDRRVAAVEEIWDLTMTASVKKSPELARALKQFDETAAQLEAKLVDVTDKTYEVGFLRSYVGRKFNLRNLFRTPEERDLLRYSEEVMAYNVAVQGDISPVEREQVLVTNEYRMMFGRWPLRLVEKLVMSSRGHCEEMTRIGYFGHFSPTPGRRTPYDRMRLAGYEFGSSENIIAGQTSAKGAHDGWCRSSGHHRNILMPPWTEMGTGQYGRLMCQNFGQARRWSKDDPKPGEEEADGGTGYEWEDPADDEEDAGADDEDFDYEDEDD